MSLSSEPLVSIIIGVHNLSPRWKKAISSIKKQTYKNWECVICDDGSTDDTYNKLKLLEKRDSRFKVIKNDTNLGLAAALNKCLRYSKGQFIARMDDDDISLNNRIEVEVNFLMHNSKYDFVASNYYIDNGEHRIPQTTIEEPKLQDFLWTSPFLHPATMFRIKSLEKVSGYTEGRLTSRAEDYDLYMKLYSKGFFGYNIQELLFIYFVGEKEVKKKSKYKYRIYEAIIRFKGFKRLKLSLLKSSPFIVKPLIVGVLPKKLTYYIRTKSK